MRPEAAAHVQGAHGEIAGIEMVRMVGPYA